MYDWFLRRWVGGCKENKWCDLLLGKCSTAYETFLFFGGKGGSTARVGDLLYVVLTVPLVGGW